MISNATSRLSDFLQRRTTATTFIAALITAATVLSLLVSSVLLANSSFEAAELSGPSSSGTSVTPYAVGDVEAHPNKSQSNEAQSNDGSAGGTHSAVNGPIGISLSNLHSKPVQESWQRGGFRRNESKRSDYTQWEVAKEFQNDVFTFVRVRYDSRGGSRGGGGWANDYPDCDWNFSVRLHELTSMKVDPDGKVMRLTDPEIFSHPFLFMTNAYRMGLSEEETAALRKYLLKGGFLMVDDFWAPQGWRGVYREMQKVFPDREPRELPRDHEIFNIVYQIKGTPQVPSIRAWQRGHTFEYWHGDPMGDEDPHFWGYFDDEGRLMALLCHNNDIADGWEREGENKEYFRDYSERVSYPLGINIITYVMTH